jgi:hypothetical protein
MPDEHLEHVPAACAVELRAFATEAEPSDHAADSASRRVSAACGNRRRALNYGAVHQTSVVLAADAPD